jgi:hypothetical protein
MATDFLTFNEGTDHVLSAGMPSTCYFLLSTENVGALSATDTLSGGIGEITGTGYIRQSQALPTPVAGDITWASSTWNTGSATDWPSSVCSMALATTVDNSGVAICAWNLVPGGGARNLSTVSTTESVTPTLTTESVDMSFASTVASAGVTGSVSLSPTSGTTYILPTAAVLEDVGSNLVNNGTFEIYHVPTTGVYEITANFNFDFAIIGSAPGAVMNFGYAVGSASAGTASITDNFVQQVEVVSSIHEYSFSSTSYESLTAGQYVNLVYQFTIAGGSSVDFVPNNNTCNFSIQRIA